MASRLVYRQLCIASSTLYLFGAFLVLVTIFLTFTAGFDYGLAEDRATAAILGMVAWTIIALSVLPEIWIDTFMGRSVATSPPSVHYHSRYGRSNAHPLWNWVQTALFLGGCICQAFSMKRELDDDDVYQSQFYAEKDYLLDWEDWYLLSSCIFTVSGLISVYLTGCECGCRSRDGLHLNQGVSEAHGSEHDQVVPMQNRSEEVTKTTKNRMANSVFLGASIVMIFIIPGNLLTCAGCFLGYFLMNGAYVAFFVCGVLWLLADLGY